MRKMNWTSFALVLGAVLPAQAFFGRDSVDSVWPVAAVHIDGREAEWPELPLLDENGMGFRAMNDAANLYLLIGGTASDGRLLLSGKSGQHLTLWFLKSDGKTKTWGINIDFSREATPNVESPMKLADWGLDAEKIIPQGVEVSTSPLPAEIEFFADLSSQRGRQPVYEMRIPLTLLERNGKAVDADFTATDITFERRAQLLSLSSTPAPEKLNHEEDKQGGGHHHGQAPGGGTADSAADLPKRLNLHLKVNLAKEPKKA